MGRALLGIDEHVPGRRRRSGLAEVEGQRLALWRHNDQIPATPQVARSRVGYGQSQGGGYSGIDSIPPLLHRLDACQGRLAINAYDRGSSAFHEVAHLGGLVGGMD